jgi:penicillin-binding protein 1A
MFVGYTRKYSMAVWTGYSNRLTPIVGDGFTVATSIYRSMMQYLAEGDHPGDWTMPEGLYRSGDYIFKNGTRSNWIPQSTQASSTIESSSSSSSSSSTSTTESESSSNENTNGTTNPNATQPNSSANSQQQNQPQQNPRRQQ